MNNKFWKGKTVLVTGYEGFLGSWLSKTICAGGAGVIGLDKVKGASPTLKGLRKNIICIKADVSDLPLVKKVVNKYRPDIIFHLAAEAIVAEANKNPIKALTSNSEGTWNILEASRGKDFVKVIIAASSDKAYGSHEKLPYKEDAALKGRHPYDVSKSCADLICHAYHNTYGVPVCVTRCGNIYGPGDLHFSRIIPDAIRSALKDKTLAIRSDGTFTRDYIYVEDIVAGYIMLAEEAERKKLYGEAFNFSNERPISVLEIVKAVYRSVGKKPDYIISNRAEYEIRDQYLSARKAKTRLGWRPVYSLKEGLARTIDWHRAKDTK